MESENRISSSVNFEPFKNHDVILVVLYPRERWHLSNGWPCPMSTWGRWWMRWPWSGRARGRMRTWCWSARRATTSPPPPSCLPSSHRSSQTCSVRDAARVGRSRWRSTCRPAPPTSPPSWPSSPPARPSSTTRLSSKRWWSLRQPSVSTSAQLARFARESLNTSVLVDWGEFTASLPTLAHRQTSFSTVWTKLWFPKRMRRKTPVMMLLPRVRTRESMLVNVTNVQRCSSQEAEWSSTQCCTQTFCAISVKRDFGLGQLCSVTCQKNTRLKTSWNQIGSTLKLILC